ncbi:MAG TPA: hypothetical protein VMB34_05300 [Acetobacteraceae bacterium]|nr:hypothetical protein [Acetobacteraceae bacterium]
MDSQDYRLAAVRTWRKAGQKQDEELARHYRGLAVAYLALARFCDRLEEHRPTTDRAAEHRGLRRQ